MSNAAAPAASQASSRRGATLLRSLLEPHDVTPTGRISPPILLVGAVLLALQTVYALVITWQILAGRLGD